MKNQLKIPQILKIGFNKRDDTYSGKLAFIVYESKGKIAKEKSWTGWIDKTIPVETYDNVPTDGFVLNKDVGGARRSYGWNPRMEKVRVYDPRGFEFEITTANLLFILQECSSIKGKGIEGQFVYSWDGKDLVLLPCSSQVYKTSLDFTELSEMRVSVKEIVEGCLYITKAQEEVVYLGKHAWREKIGYQQKLFEKSVYVFEKTDYKEEVIDFSNYEKNDWYSYTEEEIRGIKETEIFNVQTRNRRNRYLIQVKPDKIAKRLTDMPVENYADLYMGLLATTYVSVPVSLELVPKKNLILDYYGQTVFVQVKDTIYLCNLTKTSPYCFSALGGQSKDVYKVEAVLEVSIKDGTVNYEHLPFPMNLLTTTKEEALPTPNDLFVVCENGSRYAVSN